MLDNKISNLSKFIYIIISNRLIGLVGRTFDKETGGSIVGRVIPKMVLDTSLLNTQHYEGTY